MKLQRLLSLTRQALDTYGLIQDGDRIAIGVSGGKDSLTLLHALHHLRRFYPEKYELCAITVDLGLAIWIWNRWRPCAGNLRSHMKSFHRNRRGPL
ncbi:MAG: hypothetical protein ACLUKO_23360 [Enterocloster bolteae]